MQFILYQRRNAFSYELCSIYTDLSNKFIAPHISDSLSSYENFIKLMQSGERICTKDVACYIYKTFIVGKQLVNNI